MTHIPTSTHDKQNRPYAKLSSLKPGDVVIVDDGFTCMKPWTEKTIGKYTDLTTHLNLGIECRSGIHFLHGQLEPDGDTLLGIYRKEDF